MFSPRVALWGSSSTFPRRDSVSSDLVLTGAEQGQCLGRDPKSQDSRKHNWGHTKKLASLLPWECGVARGCQTWELARNLTRRFWESEDKEGLNENIMQSWVTRGTCPQENGELGVCVHVCVCAHARARTHTHTHTEENCQNADFHALPCFHPQMGKWAG